MPEEQITQETLSKVSQDEQVLTDLAQSVKAELATESHKKRTKGLRGKKKQMITALISSYGVITTACKKVGIDRHTHWRWLKEDEKYKNACEEAEYVLCDLGESALLNLVAEKNPQAVIHFAKTKLKKRGYGESLEVKQEIKDSKLQVEIIYTNHNETSND